jgi:REP element-mobilizing transposase RayT
MVDHVHLLTNKPNTAADVLRVVKGITARRVIDHLKEKGYLQSLAKLRHEEQKRQHQYSLWQTEKNVIPIFTEEMFMQKVNYIHLNPVRGDLVNSPTEYQWSSARIWQGCPEENEPLLVDVNRIKWRSRW